MCDPFRLGLPLTARQIDQLQELKRPLGTWPSWGRDHGGLFFVDLVGDDDKVTRYQGETLHLALSAALRATKGENR